MFHGDAVLGKHVAVGTHLELRRLGLLLDTDVNKSFNTVHSTLDLIAQHIEMAEVGAKHLDGNGGLGTADHVVDAVSEWLSHTGDDAGYRGQSCPHVGEEGLLATLV